MEGLYMNGKEIKGTWKDQPEWKEHERVEGTKKHKSIFKNNDSQGYWTNIYIYSYVKIRHMKDSEGKPANRETVGSINRWTSELFGYFLCQGHLWMKLTPAFQGLQCGALCRVWDTHGGFCAITWISHKCLVVQGPRGRWNRSSDVGVSLVSSTYSQVTDTACTAWI